MKRIFTFGLMLTAVFALTNCTEELVDQTVPSDEVTQETVTPEEEGIPFQVYASLGAETKTVGEISTDGKLKTKWVVGDKISVFYAAIDKDGKEGDIIKATGSFTIKTQEDVPNGKFSGFLPESFVTTGTYNWYFVYDASNGNINYNGKDIVVKMGTPSITLDGADNTTHIGAQSNCLMMGSALNLSGVIAPRVQMKHSSALLALRVINQGDAPDNNLSGNKDKDNPEQNITISSLTFSIPEVNTTNAKKEPVTQTPFQIVGDFKTNLTGDSYIPKSNNSSSVTISLSTPVTIEPGTYKTFYIPIRPFNEGDINRSSNTGPIFEVSLNGSYKKIEIAAGKANLQAGTVSTLRVPVKLSYPKNNNVINISEFSVSAPIDNINPLILDVNGETINDAFIVDPNSGHSIVLDATLNSLLNALDAGFYASTWEGYPAAMTVTNLNLYVGGEQFTTWDPFYTSMYRVLEADNGPFKAGLAIIAVMATMQDGIPRDKSSIADFITLTQFINPATITFRGLISNGADSQDDAILILDEEPYYKEISEEFINNFIGERFAYGGVTPTVQGLKYIMEGDYEKEDAINTSYAMYNKIVQIATTMGANEDGIMEKSVSIMGRDVSIKVNVGNAIKLVFPAPQDKKYSKELNDFLKEAKIVMTVKACHYLPNESDYGTKDAPTPVSQMGTKPNAKNNPIIFWGLNAFQQ